MSSFAAKVLIGMIEKLVTETFFSKLVVYSVQAWSKQTENTWDDKVAAAMGEALGVPTAEVGMQ